jgi:transcriptional regulator with GAF, ATPase, and Fis domain
MTAAETLSRILGSIAPAVRASTRFPAVGVLTPAHHGLMRYEAVNASTHGSVFVRTAQVPEFLRLPIDQPRQGLPAESSVDERSPVRRFPGIFGLQNYCAVALDVEGGGVLFGMSMERTPASDAEIDELRRVAVDVAAQARAEEASEDKERRLVRLDELSKTLPVLGTALDVRFIFDHLSAIARRVVPHDLAIVGLHIDEGRRIRIHALSNVPGLSLPEVADNPYLEVFDDGWQFALYADINAHPIERDRPTARIGIRSLIRVPIWFDGKVGGVLNLAAMTPNQFTIADVPVAQRLADTVTLALSHHRLAEDAQRAEELRERSANAEMLEQLLETLAGVLDIREVFDRVSEISRKVLPHDAMSVPIILDDPPRMRVHALSGFDDMPRSFEAPMPEPHLMTEPWDHLLMDFGDDPLYAASPTAKAGMKSVLCLPVRFDNRLYASVNFYSRSRGGFSKDDVPIGRRIADHITLAFSHQRLVEEAKRTEELRSATASLEILDELLAVETHSGELDEVFDRVSTIAHKVLPHDIMLLPVGLPDGKHARIYARGGPDAAAFPDVVEIPETLLSQPAWEYDLVDDLQEHQTQRYTTAASRGYRSALRVPIRLEDRYAGALVFFSFECAKYTHADVMVARRIADRVTLVLARDRNAAATKRAEETVARAAQLEARVRTLTDELDTRTGVRRVIGESRSWRQVLLQATRVAATDTTVLLLGESGTGKEVVARFLHRASERNHRPFIALNCAALPEHLLEAELFGFERGAFTGAVQSKPGQLEQAAGGTLFLDEVGEMSLPAQAKFLRVLQEKEFQRLGGTRVLKADARIVAATNRDLEKAMAQNAFREDLFYRLNVFAIHLPPLRDRREDILPLSDAFLSEIGRGLGRPPSGVARDARQKLVEYHWPGNVRELRNILERAAILCDGGLVTADHLALTVPRPAAVSVQLVAAPLPRPASSSTGSTGPTTPVAAHPTTPTAVGDLKSMERTLIEQALQNARFNKSKAAKALGLTRAQLYVRMKRYGL